MMHRLKIASLSACLSILSILPLAGPAGAANRAYSGRSAVLDDHNAASCFAHAAGDPTLKNSCGTSRNVFLPMSADAAAWYTLSVYGRGLINPDGSRNSIACVANGLPHDASTLWGSSWQGLPQNGGFGGAQVITLGAVPVFSPGDAIYAYCVMNPFTTIFTYGWN
jgi:hypothetical protein